MWVTLFAAEYNRCCCCCCRCWCAGGARFDDGAGGDNEVQRTMLEIVNQLDGFDARGNVKVRHPGSTLSCVAAVAAGGPLLVLLLGKGRCCRQGATRATKLQVV